MKSLVLVTLSIVGASIACSAYKSVGSQSLANANTRPQPSVQMSNASTQEKQICTLTLAGAPVINGLRLGMTSDEVLALFPGSKEDAEVRADLSRPPNQFGVSSFLIRPERYESKDKFAETTRITFTFLDGRVSSFSVGYNGPEFSHVDKFVAKFVEGRNLPAADQWDPYVGMDNSLKTLKCSDFEVRVFIGGQGGNLNYVLVKDLLAEKKLQDRRAKARANASPTPK